ncbi:MAG: hypothetical protein ACK5MU_01975 [Candidatus Saccharimonadales bacterium]
MKDRLIQFAADVVVDNIPCSDGTCDDANIVSNIIIWAYILIGIVAVIILIFAGVQYITSEGEPEKTKRAQATITYTIIGLIIATAAAAIISFVTGAFSS